MIRTQWSTALALCLAPNLATPSAAEEALEIETTVAPAGTGTAFIRVLSTAKAGPLAAGIVPFRFDPEHLEFVDIRPSGTWAEIRPPDLVFSVGTRANPGKPGLAALAFIVDRQGGGHTVPHLPGGGLQEIATIEVKVLTPPGTGIPCEVIDFVDGEVAFGSGPKLFTSLVIDGEDYLKRDPNHPISTRAGSLSAEAVLPIGSTAEIADLGCRQAVARVDVPPGMGNLFVVLRKLSQWQGSLEIWKGDALLRTAAGPTDSLIHLIAPEPGPLRIIVTGPPQASGTLGILGALPVLEMGKWTIGTILRQGGSAWYQVEVPAGQTFLYVKAQGFGPYSFLRFFPGSFEARPICSSQGSDPEIVVANPPAGTHYVEYSESADFLGTELRHIIRADAESPTSPADDTPQITRFHPTRGGAGGPVTITVEGGPFAPGTSVFLARSGADDVPARTIAVGREGRKIAALFEFSPSQIGDWSLFVSSPGATRIAAPSPFTVEEGQGAKVWVEILGRNAIRSGQSQKYSVIYGNQGNLDATGTILWLSGIPASARWRLGSDLMTPPSPEGQDPIDWSEVPVSMEEDGTVSVPLFLPSIPPDETGSVQFSVGPTAGTTFELQAHASAPTGSWTSGITKDCLVCAFILAAEIALEIVIPEECIRGAFELLTEFNTFVLEFATGSIGWDWELSAIQVVFPMVKTIVFCAAEVVPVGEAVKFALTVVKYLDLLLTGADVFACGRTCLEGWDNGPSKSLAVSVVRPIDPEDKFGPAGFSPEGADPKDFPRYIPEDRPLVYRIEAWNHKEATAPVQESDVEDFLDPRLDWPTLRFEEFGFLGWRYALSGQYFSVDVPDVAAMDEDGDGRPDSEMLLVNVTGTFERDLGRLRWIFRSLHPVTREAPTDPLTGFLPPISPSGEEIAWVSYSVRPRPGITSGTRIENLAHVRFDTEKFRPAPSCNPEAPDPKPCPFVNTIDSGIPRSAVLPFAAEVQEGPSFLVKWEGEDEEGGSGIRGHDIWVSVDGGEPNPWLAGVTEHSRIYDGATGHQYCFFSVATDNVDHREKWPESPDACIETIALFRRGDCNDDGKVDISDAVFNLSWRFLGGQSPSCVKSCDADDSEAIDITDAIYALTFLFLGGPAPPAPYPGCGPDPTQEVPPLPCEVAACR
jgi:hypothetical protein